MRRVAVLGALVMFCGLGVAIPADEAAASGTLDVVTGAGNAYAECHDESYCPIPSHLDWRVNLAHWHLGDFGLGIGVVDLRANFGGYKRTDDESCLIPIAYDIQVTATAPREVTFSCLAMVVTRIYSGGFSGPPMYSLWQRTYTLVEGMNGAPGALEVYNRYAANLAPVSIRVT